MTLDGSLDATRSMPSLFRQFKSLFVRAESDADSGSDSDAGADGERYAAEWLRRERGFGIVARNWRSPKDRRDEIDLVCDDRGVLVFVEVKARAADALVPGYYAIDLRKKRALRRAMGVYLRQLPLKPRTFRFDVVEVRLWPGGQRSILHFENVPLFSKHFRP
jgi:putative endonuclease